MSVIGATSNVSVETISSTSERGVRSVSTKTRATYRITSAHHLEIGAERTRGPIHWDGLELLEGRRERVLQAPEIAGPELFELRLEVVLMHGFHHVFRCVDWPRHE